MRHWGDRQNRNRKHFSTALNPRREIEVVFHDASKMCQISVFRRPLLRFLLYSCLLQRIQRIEPSDFIRDVPGKMPCSPFS